MGLRIQFLAVLFWESLGIAGRGFRPGSGTVDFIGLPCGSQKRGEPSPVGGGGLVERVHSSSSE